MIGLLSTLAWWAMVVGTWMLADRRGRNRYGWTALALFLPLVALVIVAVLPARRRGW